MVHSKLHTLSQHLLQRPDEARVLRGGADGDADHRRVAEGVAGAHDDAFAQQFAENLFARLLEVDEDEVGLRRPQVASARSAAS